MGGLIGGAGMESNYDGFKRFGTIPIGSLDLEGSHPQLVGSWSLVVFFVRIPFIRITEAQNAPKIRII